MENHKYLTDAGLQPDEIMQNMFGDDDERNEYWKSQRDTYGFDEREIWNLDTTFIQWIYEHLMMYMEQASECISLSYHKFWIDGDEKTQGDCIEEMIAIAKELLTMDDLDDRYYDSCQRLCRIWSIVLPVMWI